MLGKLLSKFRKKKDVLRIVDLRHDNGEKHIVLVEFNHPIKFQAGNIESLLLMIERYKRERPKFSRENVYYIDEIVQIDDVTIRIDAFFDNDEWEIVGVRWDNPPAVFSSDAKIPDLLEEVMRGH